MQVVEGSVDSRISWSSVLARLGEPEDLVVCMGQLHAPFDDPQVGVHCKGHESADSWRLWPCPDAILVMGVARVDAREVRPA